MSGYAVPRCVQSFSLWDSRQTCRFGLCSRASPCRAPALFRLELKLPSVREFRSPTETSSFTRVFEDVTDLVYVGENLLVTVPIGFSFVEDSPVTSILLVTRSSYFDDEALITTEDLTDFFLLEIGPNHSAEAAADDLKKFGFRKLSYETERDRWAISCEGSLVFYFYPDASAILNPALSRMAGVEFFCGADYSSHVKPHITFTGIDTALSSNTITRKVGPVPLVGSDLQSPPSHLVNLHPTGHR